MAMAPPTPRQRERGAAASRRRRGPWPTRACVRASVAKSLRANLQQSSPDLNSSRQTAKSLLRKPSCAWKCALARWRQGLSEAPIFDNPLPAGKRAWAPPWLRSLGRLVCCNCCLRVARRRGGCLRAPRLGRRLNAAPNVLAGDGARRGPLRWLAVANGTSREQAREGRGRKATGGVPSERNGQMGPARNLLIARMSTSARVSPSS
eukprot:6499260-Alexandrium_andersonii.AAC.1